MGYLLMAIIFGIDIPAIVFGAVQGQLFAGTLTRIVNKIPKSFVFEGIPGGDEETINAQAVSTSSSDVITIIANSITPRTIPRIQDSIQIQGKEYSIVGIKADPAEATYTCIVNLK